MLFSSPLLDVTTLFSDLVNSQMVPEASRNPVFLSHLPLKDQAMGSHVPLDLTVLYQDAACSALPTLLLPHPIDITALTMTSSGSLFWSSSWVVDRPKKREHNLDGAKTFTLVTS